MDTLRIYVASLTDYNNGILHGVWLDVGRIVSEVVGTGDALEVIEEAIKGMLEASPTAKQEGYGPAEEWAIHDTEGFPRGEPGEHANLDDIVNLAEFIKEASDLADFKAACAWLDNGFTPDFNAFQDAYGGCYDSLGDWAREIEEGSGEIPERFENYIDWDAMGRDAELNGDIWSVAFGYKEVYVFWNR